MCVYNVSCPSFSENLGVRVSVSRPCYIGSSYGTWSLKAVVSWGTSSGKLFFSSPQSPMVSATKTCLLTLGSKRHYKIWERHGSSTKMTLITEDRGHPKMHPTTDLAHIDCVNTNGTILTDVVRYAWP